MYGGLFGDLPAAKGEKNSTDDDAPEKKDVKEEELQQANKNKSTRKDGNAVGSSTSSLIPPAAAKNKRMGLTQSLGAAGTSMAFIPTAIKKRKKPNRFAAATPKIPPPSAAPAPEGTTNNPFAATTTIVERAQHQGAPVDIHAPHNPLPQSQQPHAALELKSREESSKLLIQEASNQHPGTSVLERQHPLVENMRDPDWDRDEEEPITDPYDPYVPNDLLQYWDQQAREKEQRQLERETQMALENQKVLRMQLEHERQALIQGSDLERLDSRGRGRGMSNLPAWLVAKQAQEKQDKLGSNPGA